MKENCTNCNKWHYCNIAAVFGIQGTEFRCSSYEPKSPLESCCFCARRVECTLPMRVSLGVKPIHNTNCDEFKLEEKPTGRRVVKIETKTLPDGAVETKTFWSDGTIETQRPGLHSWEDPIKMSLSASVSNKALFEYLKKNMIMPGILKEEPTDKPKAG